MTKNQFREFILNHNINNVIIISYPDYNGGRHLQVYINKDEYDIELEEFEYIEYKADKNQIVKDKDSVFYEHFATVHEEAYEVSYTLEELIEYQFEE